MIIFGILVLQRLISGLYFSSLRYYILGLRPPTCLQHWCAPLFEHYFTRVRAAASPYYIFQLYGRKIVGLRAPFQQPSWCNAAGLSPPFQNMPSRCLHANTMSFHFPSRLPPSVSHESSYESGHWRRHFFSMSCMLFISHFSAAENGCWHVRHVSSFRVHNITYYICWV